MIVERSENSVVVTAKKVQDAIDEGLASLGAELYDVNVEVLEPGGIFRKAKVRLTVEKPESNAPEAPAEKAETEKKDKAEPSGKNVSADKPAGQDKSANPNGNTQSGNKDTRDKHNRQEKPEKTDKNAPSQKPEKTDKIGQSDKNRIADKNSTPTKDNTSDKSSTADKNAPQGKPEKTKNERSPKQESRDKSGSQEKPENPDAAEREDRREHAVDPQAVAHAFEFVKNIVEKMGFDAEVKQNQGDAELFEITAAEGDDSLLIGRHGETLAALSYLAETAARAEKSRVSVTVDCNGYRERRAVSLEAMARRRADECVQRGRKIKLDAMERADRRTIHNALGSDPRVSTASEGKEPYRCVVIFPKDARPQKNNRRRHSKPRDVGQNVNTERVEEQPTEVE